MTDYSKLKRLAEQKIGVSDVELAPDVVLALIADLHGRAEQHRIDSVELNHLCKARDRARAACDELRTERDQLKAEVEMLRKLVGDLTTQHPRPSTDGNAPGHSHSIPGVWDRDNGAKSGTRCDWCKVWNAAIAIVREPEK